MNAGIGDQVGLELSHVHVQGTVEAQGGGQGGDNLSDEAVQVGVGRALNIEVAPADIVQSLIVEAKGAVGMLEESVGGKDGVVRLNDSCRYLGRGRDSEGKFRLAAIVD